MEEKLAYPMRKVELVKDIVYTYFGDEADHPQANISMIHTQQGVIFIDSNFRHAENLVDAMIATNKPIRFLIHTHSHWDHVTYNYLFRQAGATIVASDICRKNMQDLAQVSYAPAMQKYMPEKKPVPVLLPDITFSDSMTIYLGNEEIRLLFFGPAHTNDNIAVFLPQHKVLFTGDIMNHLNHCVLKQYTHPDPANWPLVLERLCQLPASVVVPGHGPLADREGLKIFRNYLVSFRQQVADLMAKGKTLEEIKEAIDLSAYASWRHQENVPEDIEGMYLSL